MADLFPATVSFVSRLQEQQDVLGVYLIGSKSRGHADDRSDDDIEVVLTDSSSTLRELSGCVEQYYESLGTVRRLMYDVRYMSLAALQQKLVSPIDADHWPYERAVILFDRDGTVAKTVNVLRQMDTEFRQKRVRYAAVSTTMAIGKNFKTFQRGYKASGVLVLARGATALSRLIFALEWRWKPTDHWLEKDGESLDDPACALPLLLEALKKSNPALLREAMDRLEKAFPTDVPDLAERARLYMDIMHPAQHKDRAIHMLF